MSDIPYRLKSVKCHFDDRRAAKFDFNILYSDDLTIGLKHKFDMGIIIRKLLHWQNTAYKDYFFMWQGMLSQEYQIGQIYRQY